MSGYGVAGDVVIEPTTVVIAGKKSLISNIESIEVPAGVINLADKNSDYVAQIDLSEYLPEGVEWAESSFDGVISVTVPIIKEITHNIQISEADIRIINIPDGFRAFLVDSNAEDAGEGSFTDIRIQLVGLPGVVDTVTENDIIATVDMEAFMQAANMVEMIPGVYTGEVTFAVPTGIENPGAHSVTIKVIGEEGEASQENQ